ncbi:RNA polymerase sigma-70 factor [Streptomyces sp. NPDC048664]|uniref:RNA polymerase sigma-70 factor n=1 Tax=Streptomyces sp. NPDC048664 TaxID=3154505 RepID=UPI00344A6281
MPPGDGPATGTGDPGELAEAEAVFHAARGRMFGIAYRMVGSVGEAEDILQEVWIRWQSCDRSQVLNPPAFLTTTTTRVAIDALRSARVHRETCVGPWLPEPVDTAGDPALGAERAEALEIAVLMLLEKLTPTQRAAYVLREAFDYPYEQIAEIIGRTKENARQAVSRARRLLAEERRVSVATAEHQRLLTAFVAAARSGDVSELEELFARDVVSFADGGGAVRASKFPVQGRRRVARYVRAFAGVFWSGAVVEPVEVNGRPAVRLSREGRTVAVVTVGATADGIDRLLWLMNPAKLTVLDA